MQCMQVLCARATQCLHHCSAALQLLCGVVRAALLPGVQGKQIYVPLRSLVGLFPGVNSHKPAKDPPEDHSRGLVRSGLADPEQLRSSWPMP